MAYDARAQLVGQKIERALVDGVRASLAEGIGRGMKLSAEHWHGAMQRRFRRRPIGPTLPGSIHRRTGLLARSLGYRIQTGPSRRLADLRALLFVAGARYGRAQQYGAIIRPRRSKYLAIPGRANLTAAGVTRKSSARNWWREFEKAGEIIVVPSKTNPANRVVLWRKTKRSKWQHWWTLVKEATIPGPESTGSPSNLAFYETWNAQADDRVKLIRSEAQRSLNRAGLAVVVDVGKVKVT